MSSWSWTGDEAKWSEAQKLASLEPSFRTQVQAIMADLRAQGHQPLIWYAWRSLETQAKQVAKGTSTISFSTHNALNASGQPAAVGVDIVDGSRDSKGRQILWGAAWPGDSSTAAERKQKADTFFAALGAAAKRRDQIWGGDWKSFPDPAHVQGVPNSALADLKRASMGVAAATSSAARSAASLALSPVSRIGWLRDVIWRIPPWGWGAGALLLGVFILFRIRRRRAVA